ncbi:hypothetical protein M413DRAFT_443235 [Hebeloma cylindrosporum]|uniref:DUF2470 domain-containing protein n=1 Tax=Hebeloma cylindrosporum TaxID=76867 RepID=A0A0C2YT88_HEBCY|nr:hypothetical protein M413DRAFT_443235 [Hebeloma cylindrosporum h7]
MADPVAEKSGFLKMYMSNHPDTLVAYAKWFGKVKEAIASAEMTAIDTKSMTLTCTLKDSQKKVVVVALDPPLSGYDEVKPRLLEMKALAQEGLGMIKAPKITKFEFPSRAYSSAAFVLLVTYIHFLQGSTSPLAEPANFLSSYTGSGNVSLAFYVVLALHTLEAVYTFTLCWRHSTGFVLGTMYVLSTVIGGYPTWSAMRERIQAARIDSVMKTE